MKFKSYSKHKTTSKYQKLIEKILDNKEIFFVSIIILIISIIIFLSEMLDFPYLFFGVPITPINLHEALFLIILIAFTGIIAITKIIQFIKGHKQSEAKYHSTFELTGTANIIIEKDMTISLVNAQFERLCGYPKEEVENKKKWTEFVVAEDLEQMKEYHKLRRVNPDKAPINYEFRFKDRYGQIKDIFITVGMLPESGKSIASLINITDRKQNEKLQSVLYNISKASNSPIALSRLYETIHHELNTLIDATNFFIGLFSESKDKIFFSYYIDEIVKNPAKEKNTSGMLSAYIEKTGKPLLLNYNQIKKMVTTGKVKQSSIGYFTTNSQWLGVPLKIEEKVIGVMCVQTYSNPNLYSKKDVKLMEFVSSQVATAIERKRTEEALNQSQQEFASLFKNNPEALVHMDEKGTILNINPRFTDLFGYILEELKGRNIDERMIYPPDKLGEGKALVKTALSKGYLNYETIRKKKDGTLFPVSISGSNIVFDGKLKGALGSYIDITKRKQYEQMQQVLYNISKAANSPITLEQLYHNIHEELGTLIDTTNFYLALLDEKKDQVYFPYHVDEKDDDFPILQFSQTNTLTTYVIRTGNPLFSDNRQYAEMITQGVLHPMGSTTPESIWLGVPLKVEDRVIGAFCVQSYTNPKLYSEKDIRLLEFVSFQVATAIDRKSIEEKIRHLSFHDPLTDLYNRAYFEEELLRYNFPRYFPLSIISIDVNGLKVINDTFGHQEGDQPLQHFAFLLTSVSRKGDIIARMGGDEFALPLPSTTSAQVQEVCERIRQVCKKDRSEPVYLRPSVSLGHATHEGDCPDIGILLKKADDKMYQDKLFHSKSREKYLLDSFCMILAERDPHTSDHAQRLQELVLALGKEVRLSEYQLNNLKLLALLHDIGKIGIPDSILFKSYILTPCTIRISKLLTKYVSMVLDEFVVD